jgi:hypothetical protein
MGSSLSLSVCLYFKPHSCRFHMNGMKYVKFTAFFKYNVYFIKLRNKYRLDASFEDLTAVMFQVEVFCVVTSFSVVVGYRRFGGACLLHLVKIQVEFFWVMTPCSAVAGYQLLYLELEYRSITDVDDQ